MSERVAHDTLSIRILGGFTIEAPLEGTKATLPRKGWAILGMLAAAPGTAMPRDRLAEIFWPDLPEKAARNNLRQVLLNIQRALNDGATDSPCIVADRHSITLRENCRHRIDLIAFVEASVECAVNDDPSGCGACVEVLKDIAARYRGEFLAGLYLDDCPEFEDWLQIHREGLHRRALVLLERLAQCYEKIGNLDSAVTFARRYTEMEPWNEEGQRRLIRLLALNGQRGAAISQYDSCRRMLKQELGVLPEEETRSLAVQIQQGEMTPRSAVERDASVVPPMPSSHWERRQVTVLYCQFEPPAEDDPDEVLGLLREPQAACARIIGEFSGHVVRTNDGGLLAYFGVPDAMEHAALLAVRAGLALTGERFPGVPIRVGIHTGLIIVGSDPKVPDTIGRTSGLAIRLRSLADEHEVVVSAATQRIVAGYFKWTGIGAPSERSGTEPCYAYRAVEKSGATSRLGAADILTPLVGRDEEVAALTASWRETRSGAFRARLLIGDPGIGKSRLVHALKETVADGQCVVRELQCLPEHRQTPFQPLIGMLEDVYGFAAVDTPETRFAKMARYLETRYAAQDLGTIIPLFATMLSLPVAPPYLPHGIPSRMQRERIMAVVTEQLYETATAQPVLLIVEDLHWCDPTTLELLSLLLVEARRGPVFILGTARPEFQPPWPESAMPPTRIAALDADAIGALIASLDFEIPQAIQRRIVANADGVPLFAEELARAARDSITGIPPTLQDLLAARLNAMAEAKSTAQLAAAIGRTFPMALLRELGPYDEAELTESVGRLRDAGLVVQSGNDEFTFRHALFQDAAYRSLTKDDRKAVHRRIAETLQFGLPDIVAHRPEIAARHWGAAGEAETAIGFWVRAGCMANLQCAKQEAIGCFSSAMDLIDAVPDGQQKVRLEFDIQVGLGAAHFAADGYGSAGAVSAYARAVELGERHSGNPDLFNALWGLWACTSSRSDYDESLKMTLRLLRMAQRDTDPVKLQQGHFAVGNIRFWRGEFSEARGHLEQAMALYRPEHHERLVTDFGENAYVTSGGYLAWTLCLMGEPDRAQRIAETALAEARRTAHPFSLGYTLTFVTVLQRMLRRPERTLAYAEETIALADEHHFPLWNTGATMKQGWAMVRLGNRSGIERMRACVESVRSLMSGITLIFLETLADTLREMGEYDEALAVIEEGWRYVETLGDRHVEAELHRLTGECLLGRKDRDETQAETCFVRAISVAKRQQAKLLELRAVSSLAAMLGEQGRIDEAKALLADILERFTEGFETFDVVEAKSRLATFANT